MDERDLIFSEFTVEEMSELLENAQTQGESDVSERIKLNVLKEIAPEALTEKKRVSFGRVFKIIPIAAALVLVIVGAVVAVNEWGVPRHEPATTTTEIQVTTTEYIDGNPLKTAIFIGDEKLIETLLTNTILLSKDILSFAIECVDVISYTVIQDVAKAVNDAFGTTGLDELLESTLLGNSQKALEELRERENMLMTPSEKLAFFFAAAFCDSEVIKEFLEKGFDFSLTDAAGKNIYEIAKQYGNEENLEMAEKESEQ